MGRCSLSQLSEGTGRACKHHTGRPRMRIEPTTILLWGVSYLTSPPVTNTGNDKVVLSPLWLVEPAARDHPFHPDQPPAVAFAPAVCARNKSNDLQPRCDSGLVWMWPYLFIYLFTLRFNKHHLLDVSWCLDVPKASVTLLTAIVPSVPHFPKSASQQSPLLCPCSLGRGYR